MRENSKEDRKKIVRGRRNDRIFVNYLNVQIVRENWTRGEREIEEGSKMMIDKFMNILRKK